MRDRIEPCPVRSRSRLETNQRRIFLVVAFCAATTLNHLAFLQFLGFGRVNFALSPYFFGLAHFDRIIELGEQTGAHKDFFKILLKMVPLYPRFFSY